MPSSMSACVFHKLSEEVSKMSKAEFKLLKKEMSENCTGKLLARGLL